MRTQSLDTHADVEQVLIDMIRKAPMWKRFNLVQSLTQNARWTTIQTWHQHHHETSEREAAVHTIASAYGSLFASRVQTALEMRDDWHIQPANLVAILFPILHRLSELGIPSYLGGSIASSLYGMQQMVQDIDLVVYLDEQTVSSFTPLLQQHYILDEDDMQTAVRQHAACSLIHEDSLMKIDIIIPHQYEFISSMLHQVTSYTLNDDYPPFQIASVVEMIVVKLWRYYQNELLRTDGMKDDAEWNDIMGMLKVQGDSLDLALLEQWITSLHLTDPWQRALKDAGLNEI